MNTAMHDIEIAHRLLKVIEAHDRQLAEPIRTPISFPMPVDIFDNRLESERPEVQLRLALRAVGSKIAGDKAGRKRLEFAVDALCEMCRPHSGQRRRVLNRWWHGLGDPEDHFGDQMPDGEH